MTCDKLICVGKNYVAHAEELGDAVPEKPVLFLKPPSAAVIVGQSGQSIEVALPQGRGPIHHETEIILKLNTQGKIEAVSLGLDLTLRDVQADLKKKGHPWEVSKVFRNSAVVGPWIPVHEFANYLEEEFTFLLQGKVQQKAHGREMRLSPEECVAYAKEMFPLMPGDILFTGTPQGVGPLLPGQVAELRWGKKLSYQVRFT